MTRITDGKHTVEIEMKIMDENGLSPDWSYDFFDIAQSPYNHERDEYTVQDVGYCLIQAHDWKHGIGDYVDEYEGCRGHNPDDRIVDVKEI